MQNYDTRTEKFHIKQRFRFIWAFAYIRATCGSPERGADNRKESVSWQKDDHLSLSLSARNACVLFGRSVVVFSARNTRASRRNRLIYISFGKKKPLRKQRCFVALRHDGEGERTVFTKTEKRTGKSFANKTHLRPTLFLLCANVRQNEMVLRDCFTNATRRTGKIFFIKRFYEI